MELKDFSSINNFDVFDVKNYADFCTDTIYMILIDRFNSVDNHNFEKYSHPELLDKKNPFYYHGGNFKGIIKKIEEGYFTKLGITALWISPPTLNVDAILETGNAKITSYHGYWNKDLTKTNKYFGDFDEFQTLINVAHKNNLKIILDFVLNHTSPIHPFDETKQRMENGRLYNGDQLISEFTNDIPDEHGKKYHHYGLFRNDKSKLEETEFCSLQDLADLNQMHPTINKYLKDAVVKWLKIGVDALRLDAVAHFSRAFATEFITHCHSIKPSFIFGEYYLDQKNNKNDWYPDGNSYYKAFVKRSRMSMLNFPLCWAIGDLFDFTKNFKLQEMDLINKKQDVYGVGRVLDKLNFLDNHDMRLLMSFCGNEIKHAQALFLMMGTRGIPIIYQGTEQLKTGKFDPENRTDMDWANDYSSNQSFKIIKIMSELRKKNLALAYGDCKTIIADNNVYGWIREFNGHKIFLILNKDDAQILNQEVQINFDDGEYIDLIDQQKLIVKNHCATIKINPNKMFIWQELKQPTMPVIGNIEPKITLPGDIVCIVGSGFKEKQGEVKISETQCEILNWSDTSIWIKCPNISAKKHLIKISDINNNVVTSNEIIKVYTDKQITNRIIIENANIRHEQSIFVIGDIDELGSYQINDAIGPMYCHLVTEYPNFFIDVHLPINRKIELRFVVLDNNSDKKVVKYSKKYQIQTTDEIKTVFIGNIEWE